jgi:hypothetical protein
MHRISNKLKLNVEYDTMVEYTDTEIKDILEKSEVMQQFILGAQEILSDMDYNTAFKFIVGITQTAQEHIANTLIEIADGRGTEEQLRRVITHLAPACLILTQMLYSALDNTVLIDRSRFVDEVARRATETAETTIIKLGG